MSDKIWIDYTALFSKRPLYVSETYCTLRLMICPLLFAAALQIPG